MQALLLASSLAYAAPAASAPRAVVSMPPAVVLNYSVTARQSGITLSGRSQLLWQADGASYLTTAETSAMLVGKILDERSEGTLDASGLAPAAYTEKRRRRHRRAASTSGWHPQWSGIRCACVLKTATANTSSSSLKPSASNDHDPHHEQHKH
jgi:hypothetical protein